ncbi:MAG: cytochrome b N-terminal domain-containing protein, partial [Desulfobacterales bacterium]
MISDHKSLTLRIRRPFFLKNPNRSGHQRDQRFLLKNLVLHFRPRTVPERTLKFTLSWGLGGTALVLVFLLAATGVMLRFVYIPVPDQAYESIQNLQHEIRFGQLIRNIHHWSGNVLVLVSFLHLLRIFFSGAFHPPRQLNWVIGICLFVLILMSNFTGYLLPWDQLAFWAITICTGMVEYIPGIGLWLQKMMRGGAEINPATLANFFAIHTAVLPLCMLLCLPFHFWRIRKAGGLVVPRTAEEPIEKIGDRVPTVPNLLLRELVVALVVIAIVLIFSVLVNAPLEQKANPGVSPNPTKAPWYFMGLQELLLHFHPVVAVVFIPALTMMMLIGLPYINYDSNTSGIWFS